MEWERRRRGKELASRGVRLAAANAQRPLQPQLPFVILLPPYRLSPPPRSYLTRARGIDWNNSPWAQVWAREVKELGLTSGAPCYGNF